MQHVLMRIGGSVEPFPRRSRSITRRIRVTIRATSDRSSASGSYRRDSMADLEQLLERKGGKGFGVCYGCGFRCVTHHPFPTVHSEFSVFGIVVREIYRLQTDEPSAAGYLDPEQYEEKAVRRQLHQVLCERCRQLSHGKMVPGVEDIGIRERLMTNGAAGGWKVCSRGTSTCLPHASPGLIRRRPRSAGWGRWLQPGGAQAAGHAREAAERPEADRQPQASRRRLKGPGPWLSPDMLSRGLVTT